MSEQTIPEGDYYTTDPYSETLSCESPEEALAEWADRLCDPDAPRTRDEDIRAHCPVTLYVWRRQVVSEGFVALIARNMLDRAYEDYDDDYGPLDDPTDWPDTALSEAHRAIEAALRALFDSVEVWRCKRVAEVVLDAEQVAALLGEGDANVVP